MRDPGWVIIGFSVANKCDPALVWEFDVECYVESDTDGQLEVRRSDMKVTESASGEPIPAEFFLELLSDTEQANLDEQAHDAVMESCRVAQSKTPGWYWNDKLKLACLVLGYVRPCQDRAAWSLVVDGPHHFSKLYTADHRAIAGPHVHLMCPFEFDDYKRVEPEPLPHEPLVESRVLRNADAHYVHGGSPLYMLATDNTVMASNLKRKQTAR